MDDIEDTSVLDDIKKEHKDKSDHEKTVETLMNEKYKRRKTNLQERQVSLITTLDVIAQLYDIDFLKNWVDWYTEFKTSVGGKGRDDIVKISIYKGEQLEKQNAELMKMLGGR